MMWLAVATAQYRLTYILHASIKCCNFMFLVSFQRDPRKIKFKMNIISLIPPPPKNICFDVRNELSINL